jgi:hypothetical protein
MRNRITGMQEQAWRRAVSKGNQISRLGVCRLVEYFAEVMRGLRGGGICGHHLFRADDEFSARAK